MSGHPDVDLDKEESGASSSLSSSNPRDTGDANSSDEEKAQSITTSGLFGWFKSAVQQLPRNAVKGTAVGARLHKLAANQGNTASRITLGDYYYYGLGPNGVDMQKAARQYRKAAQMKDAHAMFSVANMYAFGEGVPLDWHLAHRYFDQAVATDRDAFVPVNIARFFLFFREMYLGLSKGMGSEGMSPTARWLLAIAHDRDISAESHSWLKTILGTMSEFFAGGNEATDSDAAVGQVNDHGGFG